MKVLIILGHPRKETLCEAMFEAYCDGARHAGATIETLVLADMAFDPDVHLESPEQQGYETDLIHARNLIDWAEHLVFVYPTWWGNVPALLKAFLDRIVTPGFGFKFKAPDKLAWDGLWRGKTLQLITTMDTPPVLHRLLYRQPGTNALLRATFGFCGATARRGLMFGPVRLSSMEQRRVWLTKAYQAGFAVHGTLVERLRWRCTGWLQALRLQFYPMSWAAYTIGALAVVGSDAFATAIYWWGYLLLFALEAGTVFANDYFDYFSDKNNRASGPFNGGSRVLIEGRLTFAQLRAGITTALIVAMTAAVFTVYLAPHRIPLLVLLAIAFIATVGYTAPPLKLCHRGLGELDVALTHSFMVLLIGYLLQGGHLLAEFPWLLALPLCLSIIAAITLSGLPDRDADSRAGKKPWRYVSARARPLQSPLLRW